VDRQQISKKFGVRVTNIIQTSITTIMGAGFPLGESKRALGCFGDIDKKKGFSDTGVKDGKIPASQSMRGITVSNNHAASNL
jgi:hypothetical protein